MTTAIFEEKSQVEAAPEKAFETVSEPLSGDRRKSPIWVPRVDSYGGDTILIGFDTEYQAQGDRNEVLSYQFYACDPTGKIDWRGIHYPRKNGRVKLAWFLSHVISEGLRAGRLRRWPKRVYLIGHFSLADLTTFEDFETYKTEFDSIRKTYLTIGQESSIIAWDVDRHKHKISLVLRDSMLLAPGGKQSLKVLGDLTGVEKLELKDGEIEQMKTLLATDPSRFEDYALRDPEIAVRYCLRLMALNQELFGDASIPATLSSIGVSYLLKVWEENMIDRHAVLGTEVVVEKHFNLARGYPAKRSVTVPTADRYSHESFVTECYHGGRNEQFFFGASEVGDWTDYDLAGAYTTAMSLIGMPRWDQIRPSRDLGDYQPHVLGYARIRFRFPDNTRFPCLPVRTPTGLIFPLTGETFCCAPEIYLAQTMGAQVEIIHGIILPADFNQRPFEQFIADCTKRRKLFEKKSLEELFWKELGNGTYGKTAQGLRRKRCFDARSGTYQNLPESKITNPYFAAFVTSFVRAAVGEVMARLPLTVSVSNVTTDGFLSTATPAEALAASQGPICRLYAQARLRLVGNVEVLEVKHQVKQALGWRTRGQSTLIPVEGSEPVLAKAGLQAPTKDKAEQNAWINDLFINRTANSTQTLKLLRTLPDIYKNGGDLVSRELVRRVSMEYDWKRCPASITTRPIGDVPHLYFDTKPWLSVADYQKCRDDWERFTSVQGGVLKTESDLAGFHDYRNTPVYPGIRKPRHDTSVATARRMTLRALVRSAWGLDAAAMSYVEVAHWLTSLGYATKREDLENANRPSVKLTPHLVVRTPATERFVAVVRERFPTFAPEMLFVPVTIASNVVTLPSPEKLEPIPLAEAA